MRRLDWIPADYMDECVHEGTIYKLEYETDDYFHAGKRIEKHAWVYIPYGYKKGQSYPCVYFMHGAGTDLDTFLYPAGQPLLFYHVLNHMIEAGEIPPMIMVFPTYYQGEYGPSNCTKETDLGLAACFPKELREDLIPAVEKEYLNVPVHYSLRNREEHKRRIFAGFSVGGVIAWNVFADCLDLVSSFGMLSGDCWKKEWMGGSKCTVETVDLLEESVNQNRYSKEAFTIFAYTGEKDAACIGMEKQIEEMYRRKNTFDRENVAFTIMEGGLHNYDYGFLYLYHCLKEWYRREQKQGE